jgi:hypothetical protein
MRRERERWSWSSPLPRVEKAPRVVRRPCGVFPRVSPAARARLRSLDGILRGLSFGSVHVRPPHSDDLCAETSVGCEHAVVAVAVQARRWDEAGDTAQELKRGEERYGGRGRVRDLAALGSVVSCRDLVEEAAIRLGE